MSIMKKIDSNREGYFLNPFCFSIYYLVGFQERQESIKITILKTLENTD